MKRKIEVTIEVPTVPNFLRNTVDGREKGILIPIQDLSEAELREIGAEWVEALVKQAAKKRKKSH